MVESAAFGAAVGILLGISLFRVRLKVFILYPATCFVISAVIVLGGMHGQNVSAVALNLLCAIGSLQIGYLVSFGIGGKYLSRRNAELVHTVQMAIARELKTHFQVPRDDEVPPEIAAMLAKLS
jgi:hypothetical protein